MQKKMHLVSVLRSGRIYNAFITFADGKPTLTSEGFTQMVDKMVEMEDNFKSSTTPKILVD